MSENEGGLDRMERYAKSWTTIIGLVVMIVGAFIWGVNAYTEAAKKYEEVVEALDDVKEIREDLDETILKVDEALDEMQQSEKRREVNRQRPIRFAEYGSKIEDGKAGEVTFLTWAIHVDRTDCPRPSVTIHHKDSENVTRYMPMVNFKPTKLAKSPPIQYIKYPVRYPENAAPGLGYVWASVEYPCQGLDQPISVVSPLIQSRIITDE